jgi:hypothetical protein
MNGLGIAASAGGRGMTPREFAWAVVILAGVGACLVTLVYTILG